MALLPAPSALRTVEIISFLADHPDKVYAVADLARRVGQSRATCQAVLLALEPSRWVVRTKGGYALGAGLISIGAAAQQGTAIVGLLRAAVGELHEHTGCEILGYLPAGDRLINVSRVGPTGPGTITMVEGQAFPLAPPNGLAFAAWDERDLELWLGRATTADQTAQDNLRKAAQIVRELGYSVLLDPLTRRELKTNVDRLSAARQKFVASALAHHDLVAQEDEATGAMRVAPVEPGIRLRRQGLRADRPGLRRPPVRQPGGAGDGAQGGLPAAERASWRTARPGLERSARVTPRGTKGTRKSKDGRSPSR
jgi:DNA-binding IclR family transcriptional regulator